MTFETARLILRPYALGDVDAAHAVLDTHPDVYRFDPGRPLTREERRAAIERRVAGYGGPIVGSLAVTLRDGGRFIGYAGLQLYLCDRGTYAAPEVELFYKLGREYWGRGYATEACRALIRHAFDDLRLARIVTCTHRDNAASIALLQRLGMRVEPDVTDLTGVLATLENDAIAGHR